jgi:hypothetical protein
VQSSIFKGKQKSHHIAMMRFELDRTSLVYFLSVISVLAKSAEAFMIALKSWYLLAGN